MIRLELKPTVLLARRDGVLHRLLDLKLNSNEGRTRLGLTLVSQNGETQVDLDVPPGESHHWVYVKELDKPQKVELRPSRNDIRGKASLTLDPQRKWEIYLVAHSHTDIGYTDYQPIVIERHADFIDRALSICEETCSYPEGAKFKWVLEVAWQAKNYIERRSKGQIDRLVEHLKAGDVEVTASYLNMTDLPSTEQAIRSFYFIKRFKREYGVGITSAMNCDVNGYPWVFPTALAQLGVSDFCSALNETRSIAPLSRPCPFWWEAPDGNRVLVWHGEHYMKGNMLRLDGSHDAVATPLLISEYLMGLEKKGYPYDVTELQVSGYRTDNSPPNKALCDVVKSWNETWDHPKIRLATLAEWFRALHRKMDAAVPVHRAAWPDYWADGIGSAAHEIRLAREVQDLLPAAESASAILSSLDKKYGYPKERLEGTYEEAAMANEHTWGATISTRKPYSDSSRAQWNYKSRFFYSSYMLSKESLKESLESIARRVRSSAGNGVLVYNSLSWERDGLAHATVSSELLGGQDKLTVIDRETGQEVPSQITAGDGPSVELSFLAERVPAMGYRCYELKPGSGSIEWRPSVSYKENEIENDYYRVTLDPETGGIVSIFDKHLKIELVNGKSPYCLNQVIYERMHPKKVREAIWNDGKPIHLSRPKDVFVRHKPSKAKFKLSTNSSLYGEVRVASHVRGFRKLRSRIRLYNDLKRIDVINTIVKSGSPNPEATYFAFPFGLSRPRLFYEVPGGHLEVGMEQLPGSCMDWYTVQNWVEVANDRFGVTWTSLDAPLIQVGDINTGRWLRRLGKFNGTVISWPMNNYWFTNFPASQEGEISFRYALTSRPNPQDKSPTYRFAYECRSPFKCVVIESGVGGDFPKGKFSFCQIDKPNVMAIGHKAAEDGRGIIMRLFETSGTETEFSLSFPSLKVGAAYLTDLYEDDAGLLKAEDSRVYLSVGAYGIATVRAVFL